MSIAAGPLPSPEGASARVRLRRYQPGLTPRASLPIRLRNWAVRRLKTSRYGADFRLHPVQPGDVVFLGDSLTAQGEWEARFPELPVKNRGIGADTVRTLRRRLPAVLREPSCIFLMVGANDLKEGAPPHAVLQGLREIVRTVRTRAPRTRLYVESLLPFDGAHAASIPPLNAALEQIADEHGATFVDLFALLADPAAGVLAPYTDDGLHLLPAAYDAWAARILPYASGASGGHP